MRTLLIDADIVAYKVAARNQEDFDWGDTGSSRVVDHNAARRDVDEVIAGYCDKVDGDKVVICLSDPDANFRKQLEPTYKGNRTDTEKPELLLWAKEYMAEEYRSYIRPRLEADDIMAILMTSGDRFVKGEKVIVSEDKDMRTVPGLIYNPNHSEVGIIDNSVEDAHRFLCWQTITGDQTDGYPGCPGIGRGGEYTDEGFVEANRGCGLAHEVLACPFDELWDAVLFAYGTKGLTEADAIHQARLAYLLWADSFNFRTKGIRLWTPERLTLTAP